FSAVQGAASLVGGNVVIAISPTDKITLSNIHSLGALNAANFIFSTNHAPTDIALSNNTVAENSANGTSVGSLSATDTDSGETFTYSLLYSGGGAFAIDKNNIVVNGPLNFDVSPVIDLVVRVTDGG